MDMHDSQHLAFFPTPYPGESLYSILCRYHVRSGNATTRKSIQQLFGDFASLCSTVLLPSMLDRFAVWTSTDAAVNPQKLIWNNTAFSLCALHDYSDYESVFSNANMATATLHSLRRGSFRQCRIQHLSQELRFCPVCASEQKKIYGESFWQILPQLDGVEFCPFHQIPILSSGIRVRDLRYTFFPADTVLWNTDIYRFHNETILLRNLLEKATSDTLVSMARCVLFLWEHLPDYSGIWFLLGQYRKMLTVEHENAFWQSTCTVKSKLLEKNHPRLVNWLLSSGMQRSDPSYIFFSGFSLAQHALMISLLSDSPEAFFAA